ncbi:MAG: glycosyltransferase family 2 protein [Gemmiger sp.]
MSAVPCVSIIMPVYNAAQWLENAAESVLRQHYQNLELILVDDGSADGSGTLCDRIAAADPRVRVLHQKNSGISAARNAGLAVSHGDYIGFCDDDDWLQPDFVACALALADRYRADVVRMDYRLLHENADGEIKELQHCPGTMQILRAGDGGLRYDEYLRVSGPQFVWNALYRRDLLHTVRFDTRCRSGLEDFVFNAQVYCHARNLVYVPQVAYTHYERRCGTSSRATAEALEHRLRALEPWLEAEYRAARVWSCDGTLRSVWNERKAGAITFLMHQVNENIVPSPVRRHAWRTLRKVLNQYPHTPLDFAQVAGHNIKQMAAVFLYETHLQRLYGALRPQKGKRL